MEKLLENENKLLGEERDNNKKCLDTILDHNTSLLKHNEIIHQHPYSSKSPSGTSDKTSKDISITSYQLIYKKKSK